MPAAQFMTVFGPYSQRIGQVLDRFDPAVLAKAAQEVGDHDDELPLRPEESTLVKQADVVMLTYVLPDEFPDDVKRANYNYYEPLTLHKSSSIIPNELFPADQCQQIPAYLEFFGFPSTTPDRLRALAQIKY
jgi:hypothetical protein